MKTSTEGLRFGTFGFPSSAPSDYRIRAGRQRLVDEPNGQCFHEDPGDAATDEACAEAIRFQVEKFRRESGFPQVGGSVKCLTAWRLLVLAEQLCPQILTGPFEIWHMSNVDIRELTAQQAMRFINQIESLATDCNCYSKLSFVLVSLLGIQLALDEEGASPSSPVTVGARSDRELN